MAKPADSARGEMPFLDHLEELRWRVLWSLLAVAVGAGLSFWAAVEFDVLGLLIDPVRPLIEGARLKYLSPSDPFFITLKLALVMGVVLGSPVVIYQVWAFLAPALEDHEKRAIVPTLWLGLVLFLSGIALAYYLALPVTLDFMMSFQTEALEQSIVIGYYLGFVTKLLLGFGLVFELPVVVVILTALGIVTPDALKSKRRYAIVAVTVVASVITPGDLIVLTVFMMIPLLLLYEMSIFLSKVVHRRRMEGVERHEPSPDPPPGTVEVGGQ